MHYSTDANGFENDIPSDALDVMADFAYEQRQALMEELTETNLNYYETNPTSTAE